MGIRHSGRRIYSTADIARAVGCTSKAIKVAEIEGRLLAVRRDELGHRVFTASDLQRARKTMTR